MRWSVVVLVCAAALANLARAEDIRVLSWNVESDRPDSSSGNSPATIAAQLTALQQSHGPYDLIALTEVLDSSAPTYETAVEASGRRYLRFVSTSGGTDRMVFFVDEDRFTVDGGEAVELSSHGAVDFPGGGARRPFLVRLKDGGNDNLEFIFMVNHLTRGNEKNRRLQAEGLREWAQDQTLPIVAAGDYNFDFNFRNLAGNPAMAIFLAEDTWTWVIADTTVEETGTGADLRTKVAADFVDTNWADANQETDPKRRVDRYPGSILDFVFVAQGAREWRASSRVVVRAGDFPDTEDTSDHRPVEATLDPAGR